MLSVVMTYLFLFHSHFILFKMSVYLQKVVEYYNWSMEVGGKSVAETALLYAMASDKMW